MTNNNSDTSSIDSNKVTPYQEETGHHHEPLAKKISHSLEHLRSRDSQDEKELERLVTNNQGVEKIISELHEGYGRLGPLEPELDVKRELTHPDPHSDFNENDPWKYPLDLDTGLRIVQWVDNDKQNPKTFGKGRKWMFTGLLGSICFVVALGSAIVTGDLTRPAEYFGVSEEVIILASVTMFVLGFGFGPLVFAPMSEEVGRKPIYAVTLFVALIFIVPCGAAKNIGTLIVCRLIDGIAFSAPMTLIGGSLADIWEGPERGVAMAIFSAAPFLGPVCGPIFGGLLADH